MVLYGPQTNRFSQTGHHMFSLGHVNGQFYFDSLPLTWVLPHHVLNVHRFNCLKCCLKKKCVKQDIIIHKQFVVNN